MIRIEARGSQSLAWKIGLPIISAILALILAAIPLTLAGAPILGSYAQMFYGVFG